MGNRFLFCSSDISKLFLNIEEFKHRVQVAKMNSTNIFNKQVLTLITPIAPKWSAISSSFNSGFMPDTKTVSTWITKLSVRQQSR